MYTHTLMVLYLRCPYVNRRHTRTECWVCIVTSYLPFYITMLLKFYVYLHSVIYERVYFLLHLGESVASMVSLLLEIFTSYMNLITQRDVTEFGGGCGNYAWRNCIHFTFQQDLLFTSNILLIINLSLLITIEFEAEFNWQFHY